ncbi:MAG TPA: hypothetical protein GXX77_01705 [Candidatus Cloacimonetes bacterium]|nr:hypothetical protein [Candidatus Cloacimonadota bacterium]
MPTFSERMGLRPKKIMQIDSMDDELKVSLYNATRLFESSLGQDSSARTERIHKLIWCNILHINYNDIPYSLTKKLNVIKNSYNSLAWYEAYDFIEKYLQYSYSIYGQATDNLIKTINSILEEHNSGFRLLGKKLIPVTNEMEIASIAEAAKTGYENIDEHMNDAIEAFSEKLNTNYKMVIHHSITAAEAAAGVAAKSEGLSLNNYLKILNDNGDINSVMAEAFSKLYGYTCHKDAGIRHALCLDAKHPPNFEEAKYMLVTCSAFVNFMKQKFMG